MLWRRFYLRFYGARRHSGREAAMLGARREPETSPRESRGSSATAETPLQMRRKSSGKSCDEHRLQILGYRRRASFLETGEEELVVWTLDKLCPTEEVSCVLCLHMTRVGAHNY